MSVPMGLVVTVPTDSTSGCMHLAQNWTGDRTDRGKADLAIPLTAHIGPTGFAAFAPRKSRHGVIVKNLSILTN